MNPTVSSILRFSAPARERPRLPLMRELSAKLTEGEILHLQIYEFTYTAKITVNIQIADSDYRQLHTLQIRSTKIIFSCLFFGVMPTAIKFNHQTCLCTIEIHNVIANRFLSLKAFGIVS